MTDRYAFKLPANNGKALLVDPDTFEVSATSVTYAKAKKLGYELRDWPLDSFFEKPVDADTLPNYLPESAAPYRTEAEQEAAALAHTEEGRAQRSAIDIVASAGLPFQEARAFLRGLPAEDTPIAAEAATTTKEPANMNPGDTDYIAQRRIEIKMLGLDNRARSGDAAAIATRKELRKAKIVADHTGRTLISVVREMNISI